MLTSDSWEAQIQYYVLRPSELCCHSPLVLDGGTTLATYFQAMRSRIVERLLEVPAGELWPASSVK